MRAVAGGDLPDEALFRTELTHRRFERGAAVFHQGEPDGRIRMVTSGYLKLVYESVRGRRHTKSVLESGDIFASMLSLGGGETTFSAVALTECDLEQAPWPVLENLASRHHAWESVLRKVLTGYAQRKEQREFEFLTMSAAERWSRLNQTRPDLVARLPQTELAALIGVTPVGLSRLKHRRARASSASGEVLSSR
jgi:CRP-like cAMP-binding protein